MPLGLFLFYLKVCFFLQSGGLFTCLERLFVDYSVGFKRQAMFCKHGLICISGSKFDILHANMQKHTGSHSSSIFRTPVPQNSAYHIYIQLTSSRINPMQKPLSSQLGILIVYLSLIFSCNSTRKLKLELIPSSWLEVKIFYET